MNNILIAYVTVRTKCASLITCNYYPSVILKNAVNIFCASLFFLLLFILKLAVKAVNCKMTQWGLKRGNKHI